MGINANLGTQHLFFSVIFVTKIYRIWKFTLCLYLFQ